jgi:Na+-driven multidrug efflux pump
VASQGQSGYASGFFLFVLFSALSLGLAVLLARTHIAEEQNKVRKQKQMEKQHA